MWHWNHLEYTRPVNCTVTWADITFINDAGRSKVSLPWEVSGVWGLDSLPSLSLNESPMGFCTLLFCFVGTAKYGGPQRSVESHFYKRPGYNWASGIFPKLSKDYLVAILGQKLEEYFSPCQHAQKLWGSNLYMWSLQSGPASKIHLPVIKDSTRGFFYILSPSVQWCCTTSSSHSF